MKVVADISMSLDGFVTGPNAGPKNGLGDGGEPIHAWVFGDDPVDQSILAESTERSGAVVMGRNLFDVIDGPDGWSDELGYGARHAASPPFIVVTHRAPDAVRLDLDFTFAGSVTAAADAAKSVCPPEKDVVFMGGGDVIRQALDDGVVDELVLHVSPVVLGGGTPLFHDVSRHELRQVDVRVSRYATHVRYSC